MGEPTFNDLLRGRTLDESDPEPQPTPTGDVDAGKGEGDGYTYETVYDESGRPQMMRVFDLDNKEN